MAEAALLRDEVNRLVAERVEVEGKLDALSGVALAPVADDRDAQRLAVLRDQRTGLLEERAAVVAERMEADPSYVAPTDGLSIRLSTLSALMQREPLVRVQVAITVAMFLLLDLAVLSIALGRQGASIYALRQVVEFETRAAHEIAEGEVEQAEAATKALAAQVAQLQTRLDLARTERAIRDELRRMELTEGVLDAWAADLAQKAAKTQPAADPAKPPAQRFDA